jgi:transposase-like protein/IS1 family transposase
MIKQFASLIEMVRAFPDEQSCIDHLRALRWQDGAFCPYCGSERVYDFSDGRTHKCADCRQRFSIKVGTIFEDSKVPLQKWFMAIYLATSHKKGIASTQLARDIGVTQKTAWFMVHRLRSAMETQSFNAPLEGEVEVDETFVGGKAHNKHANKRDGKPGGTASGKAIVVGAVQRKGKVVARKIEDVSARTLTEFVRKNVADTVELVSTDQWTGYRHLRHEFPHEIIKHAAKEYVRGKVHTQTIEGFWSLLKRGIVGIYHHVSAKHLDRYVAEFTYRYNTRSAGEGERMNSYLARVGGRLTYRALTA